MDALVSDTMKKHGGWRPNSGRPRREDWQDEYLAHLSLKGTPYLICHEVGVPWSVLQAEIERNPEFAEAYYQAREVFADQLETELLALGRGTQKGNVLSYFGLLKKYRPGEYHDKLVTLNVDLKAEVPPDQALAVLQAMLGASTPATRRLIAGERDDVLEGDVARDSVAEQREARL